ncbi:hypothetical protein GO003_014100 [Methylicorpusculum oleiharenae]|uniref:hypothetical protein n=1 Tax=Methylicorpusculum oleiharenae TaxID=1338687 RepID=UPI001358DF12|nr:hypothetical protein [Methylicorpusculum oleiharenae]MCD2450452.1 hypothetical protein [Methylicorpusculum oleiharenae]MCD2451524.1 hypothetical protein [Methylicorpusculum oleiharenae]
MPLQQLVEYFNDRLEWEHHTNFRPFIIDNGVARGLFGPVQISSELTPLRELAKPEQIAGYTAQLNVTTAEIPDLLSHELDLLLSLPAQQGINSDSIVNFDRLTRTVHMLNFLPLAHDGGFLQLDVDPRHILGVKKDHGAYFQEVISKCGLEAHNVVITLRVTSTYRAYYPALLKGLENYRERGYRLALRFDYQALGKATNDLIAALAPDFVSLSGRQLSTHQDNQLLEKLARLQLLTHKELGKTILLEIGDKQTAALARKIGFNLVQGAYFESYGHQEVKEPVRLAASGG